MSYLKFTFLKTNKILYENKFYINDHFLFTLLYSTLQFVTMKLLIKVYKTKLNG